MAGWLAGFMAHEVNNHLAAALMELELAMGVSRSGEVDELLSRLHVAVESAGEVCRSTLGLLRPATGSGMPGLVGDAVDRTMACLGRLRDRVIVELDPEARLAATPLSLPRLQQVLLNAILNALHASDGLVHVAVRLPTHDGAVRSTWNMAVHRAKSARASRSSAGVEISIEDNGPGMPIEVRRRLQAKRSARVQRVGAGGLGLSILRHLVVEVGGSIKVHSARPHGTRLVLSFPSPPQHQSRAA